MTTLKFATLCTLVLTLSFFIVPPAAHSQSTEAGSSVGSGLPQGFENRADSYLVQVQQVVRRYDKTISQQTYQLGEPVPTSRQEYMSKRTAVLKLLAEAKHANPPTMELKNRIDTAVDELGKAFEKVQDSY